MCVVGERQQGAQDHTDTVGSGETSDIRAAKAAPFHEKATGCRGSIRAMTEGAPDWLRARLGASTIGQERDLRLKVGTELNLGRRIDEGKA